MRTLPPIKKQPSHYLYEAHKVGSDVSLIGCEFIANDIQSACLTAEGATRASLTDCIFVHRNETLKNRGVQAILTSLTISGWHSKEELNDADGGTRGLQTRNSTVVEHPEGVPTVVDGPRVHWGIWDAVAETTGAIVPTEALDNAQ